MYSSFNKFVWSVIFPVFFPFAGLAVNPFGYWHRGLLKGTLTAAMVLKWEPDLFFMRQLLALQRDQNSHHRKPWHEQQHDFRKLLKVLTLQTKFDVHTFQSCWRHKACLFLCLSVFLCFVVLLYLPSAILPWELPCFWLFLPFSLS